MVSPEFYISLASEDGLDKYNSALSSCYYPYQDGSTYGRPGFTQRAYDDQRCESIPTKHSDIMLESERIYNQIGLVRSIIDLITDFTISGVKLVHSQPSVEKFYQNWFSRVNGIDRSERFCSNLYKFGNVIVRRRWAILNKKLRQNIKQVNADEVEFSLTEAPSRRIPARYLFLNPSTVEILGGELARFVGPKVVRYGVKIPMSFQQRFNKKDVESVRIFNEIPTELKMAAKDGGDKFIKLDPDNTLVFHYKKEDWDSWAKPIMYGVFRDIRILEKLKLADQTALDGATDRLRIFKLGDIENKIMPGPEAFSKLNEMLRVNAGAGTRNIVWGADIKLEESSSDSYQFLGEAKYKPTLTSIYGGLGIPPTLTGTDSSGGTTNNLVSLKALIKRLEYGRQKLIEFWSKEIELVRQNMGFQKGAELQFDNNNMGDEEAEKKLYIELADRDIIPFEIVQQKFGLSPQITTDKTSREWKERKNKSRVAKAGPFNNDSQFDKLVKKSLLDAGSVTPTQIGVEVQPREKGDNLLIVQPTKQVEKTAKTAKTNGRPKFQKDSAPRKQRRVTPVVKAGEFWAQSAQNKIAEVLNPVIISQANKKNMRSLTNEETIQAEKIKFAAFFNLEINQEVNQESVFAALKKSFPIVEYNLYNKIAQEVSDSLGRELTFAELHSIQIGVYLDGKI